VGNDRHVADIGDLVHQPTDFIDSKVLNVFLKKKKKSWDIIILFFYKPDK
jgi:hypothetical protein